MLTGSIAVVGNGPQFSEGSAAKIEACETVIRINNFKTARYEELVGAKFDAWASTFLKDIDPRELPNHTAVFCTLPLLDERWYRRHGRYYIAANVNLPASYLARGMQVQFMPYELYERCGRLSCGLTLLYWIYVSRGWSLDGVVVEGFGFFSEGEQHHYWDAGSVPAFKHDHDVEADFFGKMVRRELR